MKNHSFCNHLIHGGMLWAASSVFMYKYTYTHEERRRGRKIPLPGITKTPISYLHFMIFMALNIFSCLSWSSWLKPYSAVYHDLHGLKYTCMKIMWLFTPFTHVIFRPLIFQLLDSWMKGLQTSWFFLHVCFEAWR